MSKSPVWQNIYLGYVSEYQILPDNHFITEQDEKKIAVHIGENDEFVGEQIYENEVHKIIEADQWAPLKKGINNLISLWYVPKRYFDDNSLSILVGRKAYVMIINILLLLSLLYFFKNNKSLFLFLCVVFAGFTFPYLVGHAANIRFKLDFEWIQNSVIALFIFLKYLNKKQPSDKETVNLF
ncbi:hypothetical protein [Chryseobacterium soli]|nr:hypothetical protein [Chryseobacterium soli]